MCRCISCEKGCKTREAIIDLYVGVFMGLVNSMMTNIICSQRNVGMEEMVSFLLFNYLPHRDTNDVRGKYHTSFPFLTGLSYT